MTMPDHNYSIPGVQDRTYTVSGFIAAEGAGNPLLERPTGEVVTVQLLFSPNRYRSAAWWLTGWMPRAWRSALCRRFGHPRSMTEKRTTGDMAVTDLTLANGEASYTFELAPAAQISVEDRCLRCGHLIPQA
jgi:hypothetical protein